MKARDADVRERQLGRRPFPFKRFAGLLDGLHRFVGTLELPVAAAEVDPSLRRLGCEPKLVQTPNRIGQELLPGRGLAVQPAQSSHPVEQEGTVARIRDVGQDPLQQPVRLVEA